MLAIGIEVDEPAELTVTKLAPPSTLVLSMTMNAPTVQNAAPDATVRAVAPWTLVVPLVVVAGVSTVSWYQCSQRLQNPDSGLASVPR